jgi:hypothetical protein
LIINFFKVYYINIKKIFYLQYTPYIHMSIFFL